MRAFISVCLCLVLFCGCRSLTSASEPASDSGVTKASVAVPVGPDGLTVEQRNIKRRLERDNKPGSIKHLYIFSAYSGQCLLYSTVDGKVTSGGKRLTPKTVTSDDGEFVDSDFRGFAISIGGRDYRTGEVLQDDGTYGESGEYLYWFDTAGHYYQYYITGGMFPVVSDTALAVKSVTVNLSIAGGPSGATVPAPVP